MNTRRYIATVTPVSGEVFHAVIFARNLDDAKRIVDARSKGIDLAHPFVQAVDRALGCDRSQHPAWLGATVSVACETAEHNIPRLDPVGWATLQAQVAECNRRMRAC